MDANERQHIRNERKKGVMMRIHWDRSIGIGVPKLDDDHKRLIGTMNYLRAHQHQGVASEAVSLVIEQIREFASLHFPREEAYMESIDYPDFEAHKQQHKQFREKITALCLDVMGHKTSAPEDIYRFLHQWVIEHILHEDKQIQAFNQAKIACSCAAKQPQ